MQTVHKLDEEDIKSVLAEHFNVEENDISISVMPEITVDGNSEYKIKSKIVVNE